MLSTLPKLADKVFILGFFVPSLLFALALSVLLQDVHPFSAIARALGKAKSLESLAYLVLGTWALAVVLLMVNHTLYQMLEGHRWPLSRVGFLKRREEARFAEQKSRFDALRRKMRDKPEHFSEEDRQALQDLWGERKRDFPADRQRILPTRFGNALAAFEDYSGSVHGADSVALWPHLATVIPKDFQSSLQDARANVDFLVNFVFLGLATALVAAVYLLANIVRALLSMAWLPLLEGLLTASNLLALIFIAGSLAVALGAYRLSIGQAQIWGNVVKAAFDCYLPALATQLGHELPARLDERRAFWTAVGQQVVYHQPIKPEDWRGRSPPPPIKRRKPDSGLRS